MDLKWRLFSFEGRVNRLPYWWLVTLYATIIFSVGYWLFYHTLGIGGLQIEDYERLLRGGTEADGGSRCASSVSLLC